MDEAEYAERLRSGAAWDEFCEQLARAGSIVLARSPDSAIDRAEGFRYLTRLTRMGFKLCLEHADPAAPRLIQYMDPTQKFGIDNPDQLYQWARISGEHDYRLSGPRGTVGYIGIGVYAGASPAGPAAGGSVAAKTSDCAASEPRLSTPTPTACGVRTAGSACGGGEAGRNVTSSR